MKGRAHRGDPRNHNQAPFWAVVEEQRLRGTRASSAEGQRERDRIPKLSLLSIHANVKEAQQTCNYNTISVFRGGGGGLLKLSQREQIQEALADVKR